MALSIMNLYQRCRHYLSKNRVNTQILVKIASKAARGDLKPFPPGLERTIISGWMEKAIKFIILLSRVNTLDDKI